MAEVLLIEDDPALNRMICLSLEAGGFEVECEVDPLAALDKVRGTDIIVLDINLPGLDGPTFLAQAIEHGFRGKVIVASGAEDASTISTWISADAFLAKPFDPDDLVSTVRRIQAWPF